jgi:glutaredoxin
MNDVILYTTGCPKCKVLEKKLSQKSISYHAIMDTKIMQEKGFLSAPVLEVDGKTMNFREANDWVNNI